MSEIDLTVDKLPEQILEEIFAYIPEKDDLKLVCHAFKNAIDNSRKINLIKFSVEANWQLEQLVLIPTIFFNDDYHFMQFLLRQQFSLKKLILGFYGFASFIMHNLPNLEHLMISLDDSSEEIDDRVLLKNDKLQRLDIEIRSESSVSAAVNTVLNHYNGIKFLRISSFGAVPALDIKYDNLTHLMLNGNKSFPFLNSKFLNIKVLVLTDGYKIYNFLQLSNVEKLSLNFQDTSHDTHEFIAVLTKYPKLIQLNLDACLSSRTSNTLVNIINTVLTTSPTIKCIGITNRILRYHGISIKMLSTQISIKAVHLKLYENFKSMVAEDWGYENIEHMDFY